MSEWQGKSDFEINKAVVELINRINHDGSDIEKFFAHARCCELESGSFDPCNNVSNSWPIILDNKIDIEFAVDHLDSIGQAHVYIEGDMDIFCEFTDNKEALKSAMIVYLEMNGVKP